MQERIAMWGTTGPTDKNVLVAIALRLDARLVDIWLFDKDSLPTGFATDMMKKWQEGEDVAFPEGCEHREQPLNDQSLLPEDIRVEKPESIRKIQNEWAYQILAQKTYESFLKEMEALDAKVEQAEEYVSELWDGAKNIWDRVLRLRNDNMMRKQYADEIKDKINIIFEKIKQKRDTNSRQIETQSAQNLQEFKEELQKISAQIEQNVHLQDRFNELKQFQEKIKNSKLIQSHRKELWNTIDAAFESLKSKRNDTRNQFTSNRIDGLKAVVEKMERSLKRDKDDLNFQHKRQDDSKSSQLEMQLRKAKVQVLEDTIKSKEEKLADIYKTISELENKKSKFKPKATEAPSKEAADATPTESAPEAEATAASEVTEEVATTTATDAPASEETTTATEEASAAPEDQAPAEDKNEDPA